MRMRPRTQYILPAILVSVLGVLIFGDVGKAEDTQSETGRVRGSVTTTLRHGLSYSLAGANLKLKQQAAIAETYANDAGEFEFTKLSPGKYTLEASLEGFESSSKTITVRAGKTLFENVKLELANQTASVTVTSTAKRLATIETATISNVKQNTLEPTPTVSIIDFTSPFQRDGHARQRRQHGRGDRVVRQCIGYSNARRRSGGHTGDEPV